MNRDEILALPSIPVLGSSYMKPPNRFIDREYLIITYESDPEAIRRLVPEPMQPRGNQVVFEVMRMPDSSGFGDYTECGLVIPCTLNGENVSFPLMMFLDDEPPISGGREIWGFPKKYGHPKLEIVHDTLTGTLTYGGQLVAVATMSYKQENLLTNGDFVHLRDPAVIRDRLGAKQVNLKLIPCVTGALSVAQLVSFHMTDIVVKGAWAGPARLHLVPHVNAPLADLPVRRIVSGSHFVADMTLPYGKIEHDYLTA
jgi:acetoacetate decarboxylase